MPGMRRGRMAVRSGAGGMKARGIGGSAGTMGICSGNNEGFGGIGRMVTSSVMGRTAAATAALAALSTPSGVRMETGAALATAPEAARASMRSGTRCSERSFWVNSAIRASGADRCMDALSMPVATTDTRMTPSRLSSNVAPTMMLASWSTSSRMRVAASSTS